MGKVIFDPASCEIQPSDIDSSGYLPSAFAYSEVEESALRIVRFCQRTGNWTPMSEDVLAALHTDYAAWWKHLAREGFLVDGHDGFYRVTEEFVERCYIASPAIQA